MADIRINSLPSTATSFNTDDYIAIDGASAGTRRMLAANPPFSDVTLGTSGPSVKSTLSARAPRQGLVFDGTATVTASTVPAIGSGDYTVHVVFKAASPTSPLKLVQVGQSGVPQGFQFGTTDGSPAGRLAVRNGDASAQLFGSTVLTANKWYAATAVRSSGTVTIYLNAVSDGTGTLNTDYSNGIGGMTIHGSTGNYAGTVETVLIYNRALSASEVVSLYEAGAPAGADYNSATNTNQITGDAWWTTATGSVSSGTLTMTSGQYILRSAVLTKGKRYRTTYNVTALTGTVQVGNTSAFPTVVQNVSLGAGSFEFTANDNGAFGFNAVSGTATITSVTFVPVGLLLAPDAAQAGGGLTWYDTSGNAANITLPASGVSWNVPFGNNIAASGTNQNITLTPSGTGVVRVPKLSSGATDFSAVIGDSFVSSSGSGRAKLLVGTSAADAEIFVGQGSNNSILLKWVYNATTASAYGSLGTYAGNNRLVIQGDGGNALFGTPTDSGNGRIQLATHTTSAGGIGFGTDTSLYRGASGIGTLELSASTGTVSIFKVALAGTAKAQFGIAAGATYIDYDGSLLVRNGIGGTTALTLDSSQNAIFAGSTGVQLKNDSFLYFGSTVRTAVKGNSTGSLELYANNNLSLTLDSSANATFAGNVAIQSGNSLRLNNPANSAYASLRLDASNIVQANYDWTFAGTGSFVNQLNVNRSAGGDALQVDASALAVASTVRQRLGRIGTSGDSISMEFTYQGADSATNTFGLAFYGKTAKFRLTNSGNVVLNNTSVATNASNGFVYVASCAGTPTGTPATYTGTVPIVVDSTNNKLYFYSGGAWRDAGP